MALPSLAETVTPDQNRDGLTLLLENEGSVEINHLRESGAAVGMREVKDPGIGASYKGFYTKAGEVKEVPVLEGYTANWAEGVSDNGLVIGAATRPVGSRGGSMQAFAWNTTTDQVEGLGTLPGDASSYAWSVSEDGSRIAGHSVGLGRIRPCIWEKTDAGWEVSELPTLLNDNPLLGTKGVRLSPDGQTAVASITDHIIPGVPPVYISHLHSWSKNDQGEWEKNRLIEYGPDPKAVNNDGTVVGAYTRDGHKRAFIFDKQEGIRDLGLLPGDVAAKALAINNAGVVVGYSDDPAGPTGGAQAFIWTKEEGMKPLELPNNPKFSSANSITDSGMVAGGMVIEDIINEPAFTLRVNR
jgi:probable HAF family extracellular repeat protein